VSSSRDFIRYTRSSTSSPTARPRTHRGRVHLLDRRNAPGSDQVLHRASVTARYSIPAWRVLRRHRHTNNPAPTSRSGLAGSPPPNGSPSHLIAHHHHGDRTAFTRASDVTSSFPTRLRLVDRTDATRELDTIDLQILGNGAPSSPGLVQAQSSPTTTVKCSKSPGASREHLLGGIGRGVVVRDQLNANPRFDLVIARPVPASSCCRGPRRPRPSSHPDVDDRFGAGRGVPGSQFQRHHVG